MKSNFLKSVAVVTPETKSTQDSMITNGSNDDMELEEEEVEKGNLEGLEAILEGGGCNAQRRDRLLDGLQEQGV